jgi:hypothetical protein
VYLSMCLTVFAPPCNWSVTLCNHAAECGVAKPIGRVRLQTQTLAILHAQHDSMFTTASLTPGGHCKLAGLLTFPTAQSCQPVKTAQGDSTRGSTRGQGDEGHKPYKRS